MKLSTKALLYSAAIFPGGGHFLLRHYVAAVAFALFSFGCLVALLSQLMQIANDISQGILSGELPFDIARILQAISAQTSQVIWTRDNLAIWLLVACWLIASADAYRLGLRADRKLTEASPRSDHDSAATRQGDTTHHE